MQNKNMPGVRPAQAAGAGAANGPVGTPGFPELVLELQAALLGGTMGGKSMSSVYLERMSQPAKNAPAYQDQDDEDQAEQQTEK